jgi:hypothetical protein
MAKININDVRAFVPASNFAASKAFYVALGWNLQWSDERLALMEVADQRFYLQNYYEKTWADNFVLFVAVDDAQACFERVSELIESKQFPGVRATPPKLEPFGAKVTYVWDPSGVLLQFAQWTRD